MFKNSKVFTMIAIVMIVVFTSGFVANAACVLVKRTFSHSEYEHVGNECYERIDVYEELYKCDGGRYETRYSREPTGKIVCKSGGIIEGQAISD